MKCLTEIAGVTVTHYDDKFIGKFSQPFLILCCPVVVNLALVSIDVATRASNRH
jgi:hypothetical protein